MKTKQVKAKRYESERSNLEILWEVIKILFTWIVVLIAVSMMIFTIVSVNTFDRNDRDLFGYKAFIVRSDSMSATDFEAGDLILVKEVDPADIQAGDIIAFQSADPESLGETFTHKVRERTMTKDGKPAFTTYGTTTGVDDAHPVAYEQVKGLYQFALHGVGRFFTFLKTAPGYVCCIFLPFAILLVLQGVNSVRLFRQYKAEQLEELEEKRRKELEDLAEERRLLEEEREASQRMLAELKAMQLKMSKNETGVETQSDTSDVSSGDAGVTA